MSGSGFPFVVLEGLLLQTMLCPKVEVIAACQLWHAEGLRDRSVHDLSWLGACD